MAKIEDLIKRGLRSAQPAFGSVSVGTLYYVTDETLIERNSGSAWESFSRTSGGGAWTLVTSVTGSAATHDFTGLAGYSEIMVMVKQLTATGACIRQVLVSTDNGGTFKNASGDYINVDSNGAESNGTVLSLTNGNNANAQSGWLTIKNFNLTSPKLVESHFPAANLVAYIPVATALNAVRVRASSNAFNGGTIYIFGRGL